MPADLPRGTILTPTESKSPSLFRNAMANMAGLAITVGVAIFLTPFTVDHLGKSGYGMWNLVTSVVSYCGLVNLGITGAVERFVAFQRGAGNFAAIAGYASTGLIANTVTGVIIATLAIACLPLLSDFFQIDRDAAPSFMFAMGAMAMAMAVTLVQGVLQSILTAHERYVVVNGLRVFGALCRAALVVTTLLLGHGIHGVAVAYLSATVVETTASAVAIRSAAPRTRLRITLASWTHLRAMLSFGAASTLQSIADIVRANTGVVIAARQTDLGAVATLGIATQILRYLSQIVIAATTAFTPRFAAHLGAGNQSHSHLLFFQALALSGFLGFGALAGIYTCGEQLVAAWLGDDFMDSVPILFVLAIVFGLELPQNAGLGFLYSAGRHWLNAASTSLEALLGAVLALWLVKEHGLLGIAIAMALASAALRILQPLYVCFATGIPVTRYLRTLATSAASALVTIAAHPIAFRSLPPSSSPVLMLLIAASLACSIYMSTIVLTVRVLHDRTTADALARVRSRLMNALRRPDS